MAIVEGQLDLVIPLDVGRALLGQRREFTIESLADAIHAAFCERTTSFAGTRGELHRRQHIELARLIFDTKGA